MIIALLALLSVAQTDLSASISTSFAPPASVGAIVVFQDEVDNVGGSEATNIVLAHQVPVGTTFSSAQSSPGWSCANGAGARSSCVLTVPILAVDDSTSANFAVSVVSSVGMISSRFTVIAEGDTNLVNNAASMNLDATRVISTVIVASQARIGTQLCTATEGCDRTAYYATHPPAEPVNTPSNVARLLVPSNFSGSTDLPMVIMLHALDSTADTMSQQWGNWFPQNVTAQQYFLLLPQGTMGITNHRHWNATDVCCWQNAGFSSSAAARDDVRYIRELIQSAIALYHIDPARVYVMGFSNGAFMSYRLACEIPEMLAAIAPAAGAPYQNELMCVGSAPVSVLHMHGTCDPSVRFSDSSSDCDNDPSTPPVSDRADVPGAVQSLSRFAAKAGCDTSQLVTRSPNFDMWHVHTESGISGTVGGPLDTTPRGFDAGCAAGYDFDLWEISKATHALWIEYQPTAIPDGILPAARVYSWLSAHSRPSTTPPPPTVVCGNGIIEDGEQCDNGASNNDQSTCSLHCHTQSLTCTWQ